MNALCWNCRGTKSKGFRSLIRDISSMYSVSLLILVETQVSGTVADNIISNLGNDSYAKVDAVGRSGGIWCLWKSCDWQVLIMDTCNQAMNLKINWRGDEPWVLTAVYGSPH